MATATPIALIEDARNTVRRALETWDGADLDRVSQCQAILEGSVADLQAAAHTAAGGRAAIPAAARAALADLKKDVGTMLCLVDACAAFQRGLALRAGHADPNYESSGLTAAVQDRAAPGLTLDV